MASPFSSPASQQQAMKIDKDLANGISDLVDAIKKASKLRQDEFEWLKSHFTFATKQDLEKMENHIMSAISDFGARVDAKFTELGTAVDGVAADVTFLKAKIEELQNNPGPISPADQAILDALEARVGTLNDKVKALDAATEEPPQPPV